MVAALSPTPLPGDIEDGTVDTTRGFHLLASMKFGTQFSTQSDGRQVLITPEHQLLCEHGETSFTIRHWLTAERNAEKQGLPFPPRGGSRGSGISTCTCQTTEGLNVKLSDSIELPSRPASIFSFLKETKMESVYVKGLEGRKVPHLSGPTYLLSTGRLCCRHGASRKSLIRKQRSVGPSFRLPKCGCELQPLRVHSTRLNGIPLCS